MSFILTSFKIVFVDIIGGVLYFPVWWYSSGLVLVLNNISAKLGSTARILALGILFRYLFKPMYADFSKEGRAISVVIRFVHLIFMLGVFIVAVFFWLSLLFLWLVLPPAAVFFIFRNFSG
ncbi:MAG: hypothetical protein Q8Q20_04600 [bacterium]|nr:hypothetical protein [bacterium]